VIDRGCYTSIKRGLPGKLNEINDKIVFAAGGILDAWRLENRDMKETLAQHNSAIKNEISNLRRESRTNVRFWL
jgi:hypothetical protein